MLSKAVVVFLISALNCLPCCAQRADDTLVQTWKAMEGVCDQAADDGFAGAVLVASNGKIAFQKAYGFANRDKKIKNTPETVFAIGSAPIDFTHAGILLLKDQGKIDLDDPITKYLDQVPDDKQSITIRHLMRGRSGLRDFHDIPSDKNPDHSWIDRKEAVKRIFSRELLFKPGKGSEHSHSAWGLLAAIIEVVSGETYQQFTTERLFKPAGMTDTGFFGDKVAEQRVAVGYGFRNSSEPNSPPNWGKTSWLVMGSGGQVSTLADMFRWELAIRNEKILSAESTQFYLRNGDGVSADGDMFGFEFMHSNNPDHMFMLISNSVDSQTTRKKFDQLGRRLSGLLQQGGSTAKFSLGIAMSVDSEKGVIIERVVPGSAAEKDGLQVGDLLVAANGTDLGEDPAEVLAPFLKDGSPIEFELQRKGESQSIRVTPLPRK